jgi:hypothetical protein
VPRDFWLMLIANKFGTFWPNLSHATATMSVTADTFHAYLLGLGNPSVLSHFRFLADPTLKTVCDLYT